MPATSVPSAHAVPPVLLRGRRWMTMPWKLFTAVVAAQRRARERAQLANMDDVALRDIGLTRAEITAELAKPVWRR